MSYIAGGCSTYSKKEFIHLPHYPDHVLSAEGSKVVAGKGGIYDEYIDFTCSLGAIILGYDIIYTSQQGCVPLPHRSEELAARAVCEATGWEQVRWCKNGSDATEATVRLARYVTGREVVLTNSYHGSHSDLVTAAGSRGGGVLRATSNSLWACKTPKMILDELFIDSGVINRQIAAVIVEPVTWDRCDWKLEAIQYACREAGTLLIFDEMITGFRTRCGSAVDVKPDLACYGKAIGNGAPIACVAGNKEYMHHFETNVFMSGTYACEVASLGRCLDTVSYLNSEDGDNDYSRMASQTLTLKEALGEIARGYVGRLHIDLPKETHELFVDGLAKRGILVGRDFFGMFFHSDRDIEKAVKAITEVKRELAL